jgi:hypothetical protein
MRSNVRRFRISEEMLLALFTKGQHPGYVVVQNADPRKCASAQCATRLAQLH